MKPKINKRDLLGRDPSQGRLAFRTGVTLSQRNKSKKRNTKVSRKQKWEQLEQ